MKPLLALQMKPVMGQIYDLGSGWGNLVVRLARAYPERKIVGYELSLFPFLISVFLKKVLGLTNLVLHRENFLNADLSHASVLTCYLYPAAMQNLKAKLDNESKEVHFVISNNFALPFTQASKVVKLTDFFKSPVYLYKIQ